MAATLSDEEIMKALKEFHPDLAELYKQFLENEKKRTIERNDDPLVSM